MPKTIITTFIFLIVQAFIAGLITQALGFSDDTAETFGAIAGLINGAMFTQIYLIPKLKDRK